MLESVSNEITFSLMLVDRSHQQKNMLQTTNPLSPPCTTEVRHQTHGQGQASSLT